MEALLREVVLEPFVPVSVPGRPESRGEAGAAGVRRSGCGQEPPLEPPLQREEVLPLGGWDGEGGWGWLGWWMAREKKGERRKAELDAVVGVDACDLDEERVGWEKRLVEDMRRVMEAERGILVRGR